MCTGACQFRNCERMDPALKWRMVGYNVIHSESTTHKPACLSVQEFKVYFKLIPELAEYVYVKLADFFDDVREEHFLWTLHFLKSGPTNETVMANLLGTNRNTMMLHIEETVEKLFQALPDVGFLLSSLFSNY